MKIEQTEGVDLLALLLAFLAQLLESFSGVGDTFDVNELAGVTGLDGDVHLALKQLAEHPELFYVCMHMETIQPCAAAVNH